MSESSRKKPAEPSYAASETLVSERRGEVRHQFTASAEVVDLRSGARFSTRTTDLGPGGCFVDTMLPFPVGSKVRVALHKSKNTFETQGSVVYSQMGLGMGIAFDELNKEQALALRDWLGEVTTEREAAYEVLRSADGKSKAAPAATVDKAMMLRLIHLLIGKGILTEGEGKGVLHDPVL